MIPTQYPGAVGPNLANSEIPQANRFYMRLTLAPAGTMTIRPIPLPPTVLYWSQYK